MAEGIITINTKPKPTFKAGAIPKITIATIKATLVAERVLRTPDTAHQKSQIINGHVALLLLNHTDHKTRNPTVKSMSELTNAGNPLIAAHAGGINIRLTRPVAIKIIPQSLKKKSHVQF